jgi:hypothetical protein
MEPMTIQWSLKTLILQVTQGPIVPIVTLNKKSSIAETVTQLECLLLLYQVNHSLLKRKILDLMSFVPDNPTT